MASSSPTTRSCSSERTRTRNRCCVAPGWPAMRSLQRAVAILVIAGSIGITAPATTATAGGSTREVRIGALLSLTGGGATLGNTSKAALEIAAQRWNAGKAGKKVNVVL